MTRSLILPAAALALMVGTGCATDDSQSRDVPGFNELDRNDDGGLTRNEASRNPRLSAHFDQVDDNGDGRLTRGEYLEAMSSRDWYTLRDNVAEFIEPEGKAPLSVAQEEQGAQPQPSADTQGGGTPPMPSSPQLVRSVQQSLEAKGIDVGAVDGIWGPKTHQALQQFQEKQGMEATGQLDTRTLEALGIPGEQTASAQSSASAGGSAAGSGRHGKLPSFEQADQDHSGSVSPEEFSSAFDPNRTGQRQM